MARTNSTVPHGFFRILWALNKSHLVVKFWSQAFSRERAPPTHPPKPQTRRRKWKIHLNKKKVEEKTKKNSALCHAVVVFFPDLPLVSLYIWDTTTSIPLPSLRLYQNPGAIDKKSESWTTWLRKKKHSPCEESLAMIFCWGGWIESWICF